MNRKNRRDQERKGQGEPSVATTSHTNTVTSLPFCILSLQLHDLKLFHLLNSFLMFKQCYFLPSSSQWKISDVNLSRQNNLMNPHVPTSLLPPRSIHDSLISLTPTSLPSTVLSEANPRSLLCKYFHMYF